MVDTQDLKSCDHSGCAGSSPAPGTKSKALILRAFILSDMYYTYILRCTTDGSFYKGHTNNLNDRLKQHNSGKSDYTSRKGPWEIFYYEEFNTRDEAIKREKYFKSAAGRRFIQKLKT
jgi:putative endonuclease